MSNSSARARLIRETGLEEELAAINRALATVEARVGKLRDRCMDLLSQVSAQQHLIQECIYAAAAAFKCPVEILMSKSRAQHVAMARQFAMYLAREMTGASFPAIGHAFARDHSTVIHAHALISRRVASDHQFATMVARTRLMVNGHSGAPLATLAERSCAERASESASCVPNQGRAAA